MLRAFAPCYFDANQFGVEIAARLGFAKSLLRTRGPTVLSFARDVELRDEVFGVPAGMLAGKRVVQAIAQQAVVDLRVAHAVAPTAAVEQIRRAVHVFHAARHGRIAET